MLGLGKCFYIAQYTNPVKSMKKEVQKIRKELLKKMSILIVR